MSRLKPEIVILVLGLNDQSPNKARPEHVGVESLLQLLHDQYGMKFIVVCQPINHALCPQGTPYYSDCFALLNQYLGVVLEDATFCYFLVPQKAL